MELPLIGGQVVHLRHYFHGQHGPPRRHDIAARTVYARYARPMCSHLRVTQTHKCSCVIIREPIRLTVRQSAVRQERSLLVIYGSCRTAGVHQLITDGICGTVLLCQPFCSIACCYMLTLLSIIEMYCFNYLQNYCVLHRGCYLSKSVLFML